MSILLSPTMFMLSSTFSLSLTGLLTKYLSEYFDANLLSFIRFTLPALLLFFCFVSRPIRRPTQHENLPLWIRAFCIGACQVCFIYSLNHLSLVESVVLFGTGPLFIPLLEKLIFSVSLSVTNLISLVATFIGVVMLAGDVSGFSFRSELLIGLASGLFNAGSQLSLYRVSQTKMNPFEINFWTFSYASLLMLPLLVSSGLQSDLLIATPSNEMGIWLLLCSIALALLIINTQVFRSKAYRLAKSGSQLAPLIFSNLIFTALWQVCFYDETYNYYQMAGLAMIILANVTSVIVPRIIAARLSSQPT